ncbi:hypothetical protein ANANG_G00064320 [Anguilla anguilla]|uniref:Uncharacterized protein n=1 Tax=Anguilla anguilla TaxID=7936 RepID=A0A9D3MRI5_ANGAN|nr:hypothetical protein ANANG_G00064320 [Anguilla anguilla]
MVVFHRSSIWASGVMQWPRSRAYDPWGCRFNSHMEHSRCTLEQDGLEQHSGLLTYNAEQRLSGDLDICTENVNSASNFKAPIPRSSCNHLAPLARRLGPEQGAASHLATLRRSPPSHKKQEPAAPVVYFDLPLIERGPGSEGANRTSSLPSRERLHRGGCRGQRRGHGAPPADREPGRGGQQLLGRAHGGQGADRAVPTSSS